jgi:hypothetical protein
LLKVKELKSIVKKTGKDQKLIDNLKRLVKDYSQFIGDFGNGTMNHNPSMPDIQVGPPGILNSTTHTSNPLKSNRATNIL